jgi:transposase
MAQSKQSCGIPTSLSAREFDEFVCPFLTEGRRGPRPKLAMHVVFNYILRGLYLGCPWKELPIAADAQGRPEMHYSRIYRTFRRWHAAGCFDLIFANSVFVLHERDLLDTSIVYGDGTTTVAKKGGDNIGFSGHKHLKGDKVVAICDRNCNVLAPFVAAPGNQNESPLLVPALAALTKIAKAAGIELRGSIASFDGVYDSKTNRKAIFNRGLIPNIPENRRGRKKTKRGRKRRFDREIFRERFRTIERIFAWEDKFRRLLMRFERISAVHYALKTLAYTMVNLRHFCRA